MTPYGWTRGYVALWMLTFLAVPVADSRAQGPISAKDLAALPQADRVAVMKAFIERRIEKVQNIDVTSVTRTIIRKNDNGRPGDLISEAGRLEYRTLRCDGSYRVESSYFVKPGAKVPDSFGPSHYDQKTGVVRIMGQSPGRKGTEGRIGREHLPCLYTDRVAAHLLAGSYDIKPACDKGQFLLESLASCSESWDVQVNEKQQQLMITHPHYIAFCQGLGTGTRKVYFDIPKGMLPVRIDIDWRYEFTSGSGAPTRVWREERIIMDEPKNFNGFWMPMRIEERIRTEHSSNDCAIFLTTIKQIVFGNVKEADLHFTFPPDTVVADSLKNVWYHTGPDGEPKEPINPIGIPKRLAHHAGRGRTAYRETKLDAALRHLAPWYRCRLVWWARYCQKAFAGCLAISVDPVSGGRLDTEHL